MKILYILTLLVSLTSCSNEQTISVTNEIENKIVQLEFQSILDSAYVKGSILIYDFQEDNYFSNDFKWASQGHLPASTFKIPNSIIALETGCVENDSTLFKWNGEKRGNKNWEQDLIFKDAFHFSCVPCYQEVAHKIGVSTMRDYLNLYDYGSIKVDTETLDNFWLEGDSRITQFEQIDFLSALYESNLPISLRTDTIIKKMIVIEELDTYKISGKTGWSYTKGIDNGWFVGYIETKKKTYFFATNIEPKENLKMNLFAQARKNVTYQALKQLNLIE
jgi:beta-lactamase class D